MSGVFGERIPEAGRGVLHQPDVDRLRNPGPTCKDSSDCVRVQVTSHNSTICLAKLGGARTFIDGDGTSEMGSSGFLVGMR